MNKVSFIVPARNEEEHIERCIESLIYQSYQDSQVIVVNDGSVDKTGEILSKYKNIKVIQESGIGPGSARNRGLRESKTEFVAFCDADCFLDKNWLTNVMKLFSTEVGAVGGRELLPEDESKFGKMVFNLFMTIGFSVEYLGSKKRVVEVSHLPTSNIVFKRSVLETLGGFNKNLWTGEDVDLSIRTRKAGYKLLQNPEAKAFSYKPPNFLSFLKMMKTYGSAQRKLIEIHGVTRKVQLVPYTVLFFLLTELFLVYLYGLILPLVILLSLLLGFLLFFLFKPKVSLTEKLSLFFLFVLGVGYWNFGFWLPLNSTSHRKA